ncbi:helix-turn-helix domain-containing protein [Desulforhopalus sp. 52FAK]
MVQDINHKVASLDIGSQVRTLRNNRNLTLQELANLTGLSKPNLSQIENNLVTPPIATLLKIATALGVGIGHFFRDSTKPSNVVVTRKNDRYGVAKGPHISHIGYQYEPLAYPKIGKKMDPFVVEMEMRKAEEIVFNNHRGEEFLFLFEGRLEFRCGDDIIVLEEGDSIYFDSDIPHGYRGLGGPAKTLVVIYRP